MTFSEIDSSEATTDVPSDADGLRHALLSQRQYTLALYADLPSAYWDSSQLPILATINPPLWELAHIAWFQEFFALRWQADDVTGSGTSSCLDVADELFDSRSVPHRSRWQLAYPSKANCFDYMGRVLDNVIEGLVNGNSGDRAGFQLVLLHEDMHAEALAMTLTTLGIALPSVVPRRTAPSPRCQLREIHCEGGAVKVGGSSRSFTFDNEKPGNVERLAPFEIDSRVVSAEEFAEFVSSSGYTDPSFWSVEGNTWREGEHHARAPNPMNDQFYDLAAMHVNYFEASAYCRWKNRRLPTEAEWEHIATSSEEFLTSTGHVWEWTASAFSPYPGFKAERYREYSEPWFESNGVVHQVLKGGSFVTHPRLKYPQYRNFYTPERKDMFCGFRTCAIT